MTSGRRLEALMDAMAETPMTGNQRFVVLCLSRYADHKTGRNARPGLRTLAKDAGCKVDTAQNALARAEEFGIIAAEHRSPGRVTTWTVLPEPSPESGQQAYAESGRDRPPTVPPPSRNGDTTTGTTDSSQSSPRDEASVFPHTPTTAGEGDVHPHLSDLTAEARAFVADLASLACVEAPNDDELADLAAIAGYGSRHERYQRITGRQFFDIAKAKNTQTMRARAADIFADAVRTWGFEEVPF